MAIRKFKLMGNVYSSNSAGTMKINGVEVLNGPFPTSPIYAPGVDQIEIVTGSFDNDNSVDATIQVELSVTQGSVGSGLMLFNYAGLIPNPVYTTEQFNILISRAAPVSEMTTIEASVANPPFTTEELDLLNLVTTDPVIRKQKKDVLIAHNAWWYVADEDAYGIAPDALRTNVKINGVTIPAEDVGSKVLMVNAGDVLTFDQPVAKVSV